MNVVSFVVAPPRVGGTIQRPVPVKAIVREGEHRIMCLYTKHLVTALLASSVAAYNHAPMHQRSTYIGGSLSLTPVQRLYLSRKRKHIVI